MIRYADTRKEIILNNENLSIPIAETLASVFNRVIEIRERKVDEKNCQSKNNVRYTEQKGEIGLTEKLSNMYNEEQNSITE